MPSESQPMKWSELQKWSRRCLAARDYELLSARLEDLCNAIDAAAPAMEAQELEAAAWRAQHSPQPEWCKEMERDMGGTPDG